MKKLDSHAGRRKISERYDTVKKLIKGEMIWRTFRRAFQLASSLILEEQEAEAMNDDDEEEEEEA